MKKIAGKPMTLANGTVAVPLQPMVYYTNKPVPGPMGPPGPPGMPGELTMSEILDMIRMEIDMATQQTHQPENSNWVFDVERDELGFIKTITARK